jgi:hypothetical protein
MERWWGGDVLVATAHQNLRTRELNCALATMLMCLCVTACISATAGNLKQALRRTKTEGSTAASIDWLPVGSQVDACAVTQGVGCGGGPTISTLTLVNNKGATTKPLGASVKLLRDVRQIDEITQSVCRDCGVWVNDLNVYLGLLMIMQTLQFR